MSRTIGHRSAWVAVLLGAAAFLACNDPRGAPFGPAAGTQAAASSGSLTVAAANPAFGRQGQINESVTISGTGFLPGARASWQRNSVTDTSISVASTQYVSSTQLIATISIAPNAAVSYYDVAVSQDRTKGAGSDAAIAPQAFEVTQAVAITGVGYLRGVNDNGEITGAGGPTYWSLSSGLLQVDVLMASGFAINAQGNAIAANGSPRLYTRAGAVGTPWQVTVLPVDATAIDGGAHALVADPVTGQVLLLAGRARLPGPKHSLLDEPRLWVWQAGTSSWKMVALSSGSSNQGSVRQVSRNGIVVGSLGSVMGDGYATNTSQASVWQPDGVGGWTLATLASVPSAAEGINGAGTLIVGASGGVAAYWQQLSGGAWSAPIILPGGCTNARAVDDSNRIALDGCAATTNSPAAVLVPPYSTSTMIHLGGLGKGIGAGLVESMSPSGSWIVGQAGSVGGVYWRPF